MALPTTTWADWVQWIDQEIMGDVELDAQQGNADYLRDVGRNRLIFAQAGSNFDAYNIGAHGGTAEVRLVVTDNAAFDSAGAAVAVLGAGGTTMPTSWTVVGALNVAWAATPNTDATLYLRWQWRPNSGAGWTTAATIALNGLSISSEAKDYLSWGAEIAANENTGRVTSPVTDWIRLHLQKLWVIGGRLDEGFT